MIKLAFENLLNEFGFGSIKSFLASMFAPQYGALFITFSGLSSLGDVFFGVSNYTLLLLVILVKIELITGIWASKVKKRPIVSKKLQRFILKMMIYFFFIMIFHQLTNEAENFTKKIYEYMHSFTIMYFVFVHIKSITENYDKITGRRTEFLGIIDKMNEKFFGKVPDKKRKSEIDND